MLLNHVCFGVVYELCFLYRRLRVPRMLDTNVMIIRVYVQHNSKCSFLYKNVRFVFPFRIVQQAQYCPLCWSC